MSQKTITVIGSTGAQGSSVVKVLLDAGWKVRAVTRDPSKGSAKALADKGAELVQADISDESSLEKAFEGTHAIFAVTNFWEHLFMGKSKAEAGEIEAEQAKNLARAAAKTTSLEHYIWSTLPNANKISKGKCPVAHFDYKAEIDEWIRSELPDLAKKTTFLFFGYYTTNVIGFEFIKPVPKGAGSDVYVQKLPTPGSAVIPVTGDMERNPGIWVRAILEKGSLTRGKYAQVSTETLSFEEMLRVWGEITGKKVEYHHITREEFSDMYKSKGMAIACDEMTDQLEFGEHFAANWEKGVEMVSAKELGIENEVIGSRKTLEMCKSQLL